MQLFIVAISIFFLDQTTKLMALRFLTGNPSIPVIPKIFHLTLVENQGIAFGMFQNHGSLLLIVITVCVLVLMVYFARTPESSVFHRVCYGFILGGAAGNLIDRIRLGHVVDFLDFRIWPVFNIADTFITIGVSLLLLAAFKDKTHAS